MVFYFFHFLICFEQMSLSSLSGFAAKTRYARITALRIIQIKKAKFVLFNRWKIIEI